MPRRTNDPVKLNFEIKEVERDSQAWDNFLNWIAELIATEYLKEQEAKANSIVAPEEDPDLDYELKSD